MIHSWLLNFLKSYYFITTWRKGEMILKQENDWSLERWLISIHWYPFNEYPEKNSFISIILSTPQRFPLSQIYQLCPQLPSVCIPQYIHALLHVIHLMYLNQFLNVRKLKVLPMLFSISICSFGWIGVVMFFLTVLRRMHFRLEERQGFHHGPYYCMGKWLFHHWEEMVENILKPHKEVKVSLSSQTEMYSWPFWLETRIS